MNIKILLGLFLLCSAASAYNDLFFGTEDRITALNRILTPLLEAQPDQIQNIFEKKIKKDIERLEQDAKDTNIPKIKNHDPRQMKFLQVGRIKSIVFYVKWALEYKYSKDPNPDYNAELRLRDVVNWSCGDVAEEIIKSCFKIGLNDLPIQYEEVPEEGF